jgi:hypothetical protein
VLDFSLTVFSLAGSRGKQMANVKLKGTKTIPETVSVPESDLVEEVIHMLEERFALSDRWIRDGQVMENEDHYHGSVTEKKIRKATEKDIHAYFVIEYLRKFARELDD